MRLHASSDLPHERCLAQDYNISSPLPITACKFAIPEFGARPGRSGNNDACQLKYTDAAESRRDSGELQADPPLLTCSFLSFIVCTMKQSRRILCQVFAGSDKRQALRAVGVRGIAVGSSIDEMYFAGNKTCKSALLEFYAQHGVAATDVPFNLTSSGSSHAPSFTCNIVMPPKFHFKGQVIFILEQSPPYNIALFILQQRCTRHDVACETLKHALLALLLQGLTACFMSPRVLSCMSV